ncbi:receptor-type tyrosine-protein phosphatase epsilon [Patella vulgata]|uniref:receptor-type tyrosine-protein phosphatase epsilon n=1 Tax=Patella vulgata TaxID=6465 RepID=UPI0024A80855|nr:receptor-type tyrosine-protein phosphatase epsilon [Patella vulgata]
MYRRRKSRKDKNSDEVTTEPVTESCNNGNHNVPVNGADPTYVNDEMLAIELATITKYEDSSEDPLSKKVINNKEQKKPSKREKSPPNVCEQESETNYYNLQSVVQNKRIDVAHLEDVFTKLNSRQGVFTDMFKGLSSEFSAVYDDSQIQENRAKNRYLGYYPYDHNRVILSEVGNDPHSNYINASYVDSYRQSQFFIAAQGPTKVTINDFIRMIFEEKVVKVVMLTNLVESRKIKCERYWPETGREVFGNLELILDEEIQRASYTTRKISLKHLKSGKEHQTLLFHFTAWADHDVPEVADLLDFLYCVQDYKADSNSPTLVHCSAGIGRTGTFVAIDALLKEGNATGSIDVLQFLKTMRCQRKGMIQTATQLKFVYEALVEAFKYGKTSTSVLEYEMISGKSKKFHLTKCFRNKELQLLKGMINEADKNKIYVPEKPQLDIHRASSWKKSIGYVISDIKGHDMESLWNLIRDQESSVAVVILNDQNQVSVYPSSGTNEIIGKMTISSEVDYLSTDGLQILTVTSYKQNIQHVCKMIILKTGRGYGLESLKSDITELIRLTDQYDSTPHPVTVIYSEMQHAAMFCIVRNILERMKLDKEVEIFNTTRKIQQSLNDVINHKDEYDFIYKMTSELLTRLNIYENL